MINGNLRRPALHQLTELVGEAVIEEGVTTTSGL